MPNFVDIEMFADEQRAQVRAAAYGIGPNARAGVQVIQANQVVVHDSRGGNTQRVYTSSTGPMWVVKSEG